MLNNKEIENFKKELENMKLQIERNLDSSSCEMTRLSDNEPKDEGDYATVARGHTIANRIIDQQSKKLEAIERSLKRIKNGTYGLCDSCGEKINIERLKVKVFADYCISCREITEKEGD